MRAQTAPPLTDCESLLLSLERFLASRFFFLCSGRDSRIISSSSKVGSQCRRPFCSGGEGWGGDTNRIINLQSALLMPPLMHVHTHTHTQQHAMRGATCARRPRRWLSYALFSEEPLYTSWTRTRTFSAPGWTVTAVKLHCSQHISSTFLQTAESTFSHGPTLALLQHSLWNKAGRHTVQYITSSCTKEN